MKKSKKILYAIMATIIIAIIAISIKVKAEQLSSRTALLRGPNVGNTIMLGTGSSGQPLNMFKESDVLNKLENEKNAKGDLNKIIDNMKGVKEEKKSQVFENMTICVTGSFENYSRNDITKMIEENSGKASSSVSKKTTFIVAGENAGSKLTKAQELGIEIKTIEEFISMVEEGK